MKVVYFDYAAIFVILTLLASLFLQKRFHGKSNVAFIATIIEILCTSVIGVITLTLDNLGTCEYANAKKIFHFLYLIFHNYTAVFFVYYLMVLSGNSFKIKKYPIKYLFLFLPTLFITILLFATLFAPVVFYIDEAGVYRRTVIINILYSVGAYNLFIGIFYLFVYKELFSKKLFWSIFVLFPTIVVSMVFEFLIPKIVIEPFFNAIGLLFISYTIQRPEELIDAKTHFGNLNAYKEYCNKVFRNKKEVRQVFINVTNYKILKDILGFDSENIFSTYLADEISKINYYLKSHAEFFYLTNGKFVASFEEKHFNKVARFADQINNKLKMFIRVGETSVNPIANVCIVKCPQEINTTEALIIFSNELSKEKYTTGRILHAKNLYNPEYFGQIQRIDHLIEKALRENHFEVYYQPIYSVKQKKFLSAEALLRLTDPIYGSISPEIFIPAAEKSGAIHRIDNYVLEEVCRFISSDEFKESKMEYIEVNLSVTHCMQDNITEQIFDILTKHNVSVNHLNLEVTETAIALSEEKFISNLEKLTRNKIKISLDDFGSGYSNLKRLTRLPLHIVKIDKSLTDEVHDERIAMIFAKLNEILKNLNLLTVVEGVESKEVLDYFVQRDCDYIQGFYFSKPLPRKEFIEFIQNKNK